MIITKIIFKVGIDKRNDFLDAKKVFNKLVAFMSETETQDRLEKTHKLHAKSGEIQDIILAKTKELGFSSEKNGLFNNLSVKQLRPDYYRKLDNKSGIIMIGCLKYLPLLLIQLLRSLPQTWLSMK